MTAVAAECGDLQGSFEEVEDALYLNQDSIGLKSWNALADEAGVPAPDEFAACVEENETMPRIEAGIELAARMGVRSTPTVLINGWRFPASPNLQRQRAAIDAVIRGEPPMEGDSITLR